MKSAALAIILCATALSATSLGLAQTVTATAADPTTARADYRRALTEMDKGNWQPARDLLIDLYKRSPTFDVAASLGEAESQLGQYTQAAQHLAFALKNVPPKEKAETSVRIRAGLRDAVARVGTLRISVNREDAQIFVDGDQMGSYPAVGEVYLSPGKHTLEARAGTDSEKREAQAVAGASTSMAFVLAPNALPASGVTTPAPESGPPAGSASAAASNAPVPQSDVTKRSLVPVVVGGAATVVAIGLGVGFRLASNSSRDDFTRLREKNGSNGCSNGTSAPSDCAEQQNAVDAADSQRDISTAAFVVAGIAAAGTAVYWFWPSAKTSQGAAPAGKSLRLSGGATPTGAGVWLSGRF